MSHPTRKASSPEEPLIEGLFASEDVVDEDEVYARAVSEWRKTEKIIKKASAQRIRFESGPIAIANVADIHLGGSGVDYERVFYEADLIAKTDGMYLMLDGDLVDNFVLAKLMHVRLNTKFAIAEEWALLRRYLGIVGHKLLLSVGGNHDGWSRIAGIDYFREVMGRVRDNVIYDTDDVVVMLEVGQADFPIRLRHQWNGSTIYNATHGIERAAKFDGNFICGVGAHTHVSGLTRQFNVGGRTWMAVLCGSYKVYDPYARARWFAKPNGSTAATVVFDESGAMFGIDRLEYATHVIERLRGGKRNGTLGAKARGRKVDRKSKKTVGR